MQILRAALILIAAAVTCGCASYQVDWISSGPVYQEKRAEDVAVFRSKKEITRPWGAIGIIHGTKVDRKNRRAIEQQIESARIKASKCGADAIIVKEELDIQEAASFDRKTPEPVQSYISGIAIRYVRETKGERNGDIERWRQTHKGW